jgi:hypothetical protein
MAKLPKKAHVATRRLNAAIDFVGQQMQSHTLMPGENY